MDPNAFGDLSGMSTDDILKKANDMVKSMSTDAPPVKNKDEVNFDDISSDSENNEDDQFNDSVDGDHPDDKDDPADKDISVDERFVRAESCKMSGNEAFKKNDNSESLKMYNKGIKLLEAFDSNEKDEQAILPQDYKVKFLSLKSSLFLNKAAVCNRLERYKDSISACSNVLKFASKLDQNDIAATKIKAYLRRGVSYEAIGSITSAKDDFRKVLELDSKNRDAIKELNKIKVKGDEEKRRAKDTFGDIFQKKNLGIYDDEEAERRRKAQKEKEERELYDNAMKSVEEEKRMSFEAWKDQQEENRKAAEKKRQHEQELRRKQEDLSRELTRSTAKIAPAESEDDLDEEDLAAIAEVRKKGYRNFWKEKTEDEKELLSHIAPSKIAEESKPLPLSNASLSKDASGSAWNNAKTWEEKDVSEEIKSELKSRLAKIHHVSKEFSCDLRVDKVSSVSGDVQVVFVSGKKGSVYDICIELKWKGKLIIGDEEKQLSGTLKFPEVANGIKEHDFETERTFSSSRMEKLNEVEKGIVHAEFIIFENSIKDNIFEIVEGQFILTS